MASMDSSCVLLEEQKILEIDGLEVLNEKEERMAIESVPPPAYSDLKVLCGPVLRESNELAMRMEKRCSLREKWVGCGRGLFVLGIVLFSGMIQEVTLWQ